MKTVKDILLGLLLTMTLLTMGACVSEESYEDSEQKQPCLTLRLSLGREVPFLRASGNPTGGENGDGLEAGIHHENDIDNLCVFKYNSGQAGINADDNVTVVKLAYVDNIAFEPESTPFNDERITKDVPLEGVEYEYTNNDQFIVVVNAGNIMGNTTTLGALRDHLMQNAWTKSDDGIFANYTNFTMTNAEESYYTAGDNTPNNPRTIHVNVERTAARIDFAIDGSTVEGDYRVYNVNGESGSKVFLSHVKAFNVMQEPTYLIKRLAKSNAEIPGYLAYEDNPAQKYVIEPYTWLKTNAGKTETNLNRWYGTTRQPSTTDAFNTWFTDADKVHVGSGHAFSDGVSYDNLFDNTFYVVSYSNENTASIADTDGKVTTGMKLKAIFVPGKVYSYNGTELTTVAYTAGKTFYRYQPVTSSNDYNDTHNLYFLNQDEALAYKADHPEEMAIVKEYTKGICYYTAWLRHDRQYDSNNETIGQNMMEFGIVRNNIYRLKVEFSGPGSNIPNTEDNPEGIRTYIYVKKWNYIEHPQIEI